MSAVTLNGRTGSALVVLAQVALAQVVLALCMLGGGNGQ